MSLRKGPLAVNVMDNVQSAHEFIHLETIYRPLHETCTMPWRA
jgi:hypothetical protein